MFILIWLFKKILHYVFYVFFHILAIKNWNVLFHVVIRWTFIILATVNELLEISKNMVTEHSFLIFDLTGYFFICSWKFIIPDLRVFIVILKLNHCVLSWSCITNAFHIKWKYSHLLLIGFFFVIIKCNSDIVTIFREIWVELLYVLFRYDMAMTDITRQWNV